MAKVYLIQEPGDKNVSPAKEFGEFRVLLLNHDIHLGTNHCVDTLARKLIDITSEDSLLLLGDPFYIGLAVHMAIHFGEGKVNILRWQRETLTYNREYVSL